MITIYTIAVFIALFFQAFFTASETAFTSVSRIRLKELVEIKDPHALMLRDFLNRRGAFLGTTLVGTNIAVVVASTLATRIFAEYFDSDLSAALTTVILVPVTLIFAEITPKMIGRHFSTSMALRTVVPLNNFRRVFSPLIAAVTSAARFLLIPFGRPSTPWELTFTKRDLKSIVISGREAGEVEADEVELIHKVLDFGAKSVDNIMVPLYRVSSIASDDAAGNLKNLVSLTGYSRIPVYKKSKSDIVGIINIYDVLFASEEVGDKAGLEDFIREAVYLKRTDGLDIALRRLRYKKQPMGIVTDEKQQAVGIVTIEDILEEIVGEIEDRG
ncbi:MAG: hemolysin family protein [Candidatus Omnitrophota bacterium]|jgi:CBS domain containing-hemolysin-like protein